MPVVLPLRSGIAAPAPVPLEEGFGIIRGPGYAFFLKAPEGWVIDAESGVAQGLPAVFYPKGATWAESPSVAYARALPRTKGIPTVEAAVNAAVEVLRSRGNPGCSAKFLKTIRTAGGREGMIYRFDGSGKGDVEATAYFREKRTIDFVTLSCRSESVFDAALPAFEQLAASYEFQPDKIPVDPEKQGFFRDAKPEN